MKTNELHLFGTFLVIFGFLDFGQITNSKRNYQISRENLFLFRNLLMIHDETMIKPKTENPLKRANIFMNTHWNINFKLKTPSDVVHTHFREEVPEISLDKL